MKQLIGGIIVLTLVIGLIVWRLSSSIRPLPPTNGSATVAFGDSLVEGVVATPGNDFVSILSRNLNTPIVNAGKGGDTSQSGLARLTSDVLSHNPRVVILLLGGNDVLQKIPKKQIFQNLAMIIDQIQQQGAAVILIGIRGNVLYDDYQRSFKKLAHEKRTYYIPDALKGIFGNPKLMSDTVHPNDEGFQILASRIEPILRKLLQN